jgi:hypothetical protein
MTLETPCSANTAGFDTFSMPSLPSSLHRVILVRFGTVKEYSGSAEPSLFTIKHAVSDLDEEAALQRQAVGHHGRQHGITRPCVKCNFLLKNVVTRKVRRLHGLVSLGARGCAYLGASRSRWSTKRLADRESIGPEPNPPARLLALLRFEPAFDKISTSLADRIGPGTLPHTGV